MLPLSCEVLQQISGDVEHKNASNFQYQTAKINILVTSATATTRSICSSVYFHVILARQIFQSNFLKSNISTLFSFNQVYIKKK